MRTVNCLRERLVKEGIFHIQPVNGPSTGESQRQDSVDGGRLDDGAESLTESMPVARAFGKIAKNPTRLVAQTAKHPTRLVAINCAIRLELVLEYPLAGDDVGMWWSRDQIPRFVLQEGVVLFLHSCPPI